MFLSVCAGAFQAFDQEGDGTIRLSVLEVRTCQRTASQLQPTDTKEEGELVSTGRKRTPSVCLCACSGFS